jgi:hypothetical protein
MIMDTKDPIELRGELKKTIYQTLSISHKAAQYSPNDYGKITGCSESLSANDYVVASSEIPCGSSIILLNKRTDKMLRVKVGDTRPKDNKSVEFVEFIVTKRVAEKLNVLSQDEVGVIRLPDELGEQKNFLDRITNNLDIMSNEVKTAEH